MLGSTLQLGCDSCLTNQGRGKVTDTGRGGVGGNACVRPLIEWAICILPLPKVHLWWAWFQGGVQISWDLFLHQGI